MEEMDINQSTKGINRIPQIIQTNQKRKETNTQ